MVNISSSTGLPATSASGRLEKAHITTTGGAGTVVGTVPTSKLWTDVQIAIVNRGASTMGVELAIHDGADA